MNSIGIIIKINGPLVTAILTEPVQLMEMVKVSELYLIGEILSVDRKSVV